MLDSWADVDNAPPSEHMSTAQDKTSRESVLLSCTRTMTPSLSGSFTLAWDAVCNIFDGVYLSWDPGIFEYTLTYHGTWTAGSMTLRDEDTHCMCDIISVSAQTLNPQLAAHIQLQLRTGVEQTLQGAEEIWVQLTRHVSDTKRTSEYISLLVVGDEESSKSSLDINPNGLKVRAPRSSTWVPLTLRSVNTPTASIRW